MEEALFLAGTLSKCAPLAVESVLKTVGIAWHTPIEKGIEIEIEEMKKLNKSKDIIEGFMAFMEKRKPVFKGE